MATAITARRLETVPARRRQLAVVPRIVLADDRQEVLEAVKSILSAEFTIVGTAANGMHAVELAASLAPDILVLDIAMPIVNGIEAAYQLRGRASQLRIIFLTVHSDPEFVEAALAAGASGYVLKAFVAGELVPAVWAAVHGEIFISHDIHLP